MWCFILLHFILTFCTDQTRFCARDATAGQAIGAHVRIRRRFAVLLRRPAVFQQITVCVE